MLTQEELKHLLIYDSDLGIFTWNNPKLKAAALPGSIAGCFKANNVSISLNGKHYQAHKLAFLYMENTYPEVIFHNNGNRLDNRWVNLSKAIDVPDEPLTESLLKRFFIYEPDTGNFIRKVSTSKQAVAGSISGGRTKSGYLITSLGKHREYNHRLAFLYMVGRLPLTIVDHIDGNPSNNAWLNLRECTSSQNLMNSKLRDNHPTGYKCITKSADGLRYQVQIKVEGRQTYKSFHSLEEAVNYAEALRKDLHKEFARHF